MAEKWCNQVSGGVYNQIVTPPVNDWLLPLPDSKSGEWTISHFTVSKEDSNIHLLRGLINAVRTGKVRYCPPGTYTKLSRGSTTVMSTTPDELRDFRFLKCVVGDGLIAGLGLGCVPMFILSYPSYTRTITVIEKSADVIALVGPTLTKAFGDRIKIINADIFTWKPPKGSHWEWGWYDIWDDICTGNLTEITRIKRRFAGKVIQQFAWVEKDLRAIRLRNKHREKGLKCMAKHLFG